MIGALVVRVCFGLALMKAALVTFRDGDSDRKSCHQKSEINTCVLKCLSFRLLSSNDNHSEQRRVREGERGR